MGKKRLHPLAVFSMENVLLLSCGSSLPLRYNALAGAGLCLFARLNFSMLVSVPFPEVFGFVRFFLLCRWADISIVMLIVLFSQREVR